MTLNRLNYYLFWGGNKDYYTMMNGVNYRVQKKDGVTMGSGPFIIMVDVNGKKVPNQLGIDVFVFCFG